MTDEKGVRITYDFSSVAGILSMFPVLARIAWTTLEGLYPHLWNPHLYNDPVLAVYVAEGCWLKYQGEGETGDDSAARRIWVWRSMLRDAFQRHD